MTINTRSLRATAALLGFATFSFAPAAKAQLVPRVASLQAPVGGFRAIGATASRSASVAAASMMPEISSWESVFAAPSAEIHSALPAAAAAPAAIAAAAMTPLAAAPMPESAAEKRTGAPGSQPAVLPAKMTGTSGVEARIAPRLAEVESFRAGPKEETLFAAPSDRSPLAAAHPNPIKNTSGAATSVAPAAAPAAQHTSEFLSISLLPATAAAAITYFGTVWAQTANAPGAGILVLMAAAIGGLFVYAVQCIVETTIAIHAIDSAHAADLARRKKALGID